MSSRLDHLMWAAPSLEQGVAAAESLFGVRPEPGGVHPGLGTCNALLSLGDVYLEVIAPDPAQSLEGNFGGMLSRLGGPSLLSWAVAGEPLETVAERARTLSLSVRGPTLTERDTPAGERLRWQLLFLGGHGHGSLVPFFIDWMACPHPATTNPVGGQLRSLVLHSPAAAGLETLLGELEIEASVEPAAQAGLVAEIETGHGLVKIETSEETRGWSI